MNKLAIILPFYKRHSLTDLCFENLFHQSEKFGFDVICIGSEGERSRILAATYEFEYLEMPNNPVSNKFNAGLLHLKGRGYDGVIVMGSDNFISDSVIEHYLTVDTSINAVYGFSDLHFYKTNGWKLGTDSSYQYMGMTIGVGRMFTKVLLEKAKYSLWRKELNSGMDSSANSFAKSLGAIEIKIPYTDKYFILDVKHELNISKHEIIQHCKLFQDHGLIKKYCPLIYGKLMQLSNENITRKTIKTKKVMKTRNPRATVTIEILKPVAGMKVGDVKTVSKHIGTDGQIKGWCKILSVQAKGNEVQDKKEAEALAQLDNFMRGQSSGNDLQNKLAELNKMSLTELRKKYPEIKATSKKSFIEKIKL